MNTVTYKQKQTMKNTFCIFRQVDFKNIKDKTPNFISSSGSHYFYTKEGVFRCSDHWGRTANSKWRLIPDCGMTSKAKVGFAFWTDFHKDNVTEKLYFIEVDFENNIVNFNHKNNLIPGALPVLRTATATSKVIRQIRKLLENKAWTKHFETPDIEKKVVTALIFTDKTLPEIKSEFLQSN